MAKSKSARSKSKRKTLTPDEKKERERQRAQRAFERQNRTIFLRAGFTRISGVDGKHFQFDGIKSEMDDLLVLENVIVLLEYTTSTGSKLATHAKGKSGSHNKIAARPYEFLKLLSELSPPVKEFLDSYPYSENQTKFVVIYCSEEEVEDHHKQFFENTKFMPRHERIYFYKLCSTLKRSARYELFEYFGINPNDVGSGGVITTTNSTNRYHGSLLPPEHSSFPTGFRIASFYVDAESLLRRAYVLRRGGWKDSLNLYQRMILPGKISAIRRHLREQHRVFANNIVITLPSDTEFRNIDEQIINTSRISTITPASVIIKDNPNSIGIIDGQHRVFSYYEDLEPDELIDKFRKQQNLLATGIVYPSNMSTIDKERFEAELFLEINSNQAGAKSDLKQAIWLILDPFKPVSVARTVVNRLAATNPLAGILEKSAYDVGRLRTTTIVTYGIQPLVKRSGEDSLFSVWSDREKSKIASHKSTAVLERYIDFCVCSISAFLVDARAAIGANKWRIAQKDDEGILTVTVINSLIILMRKLIEGGHFANGTSSVDLAPLSTMNFSRYKSSQYASLAASMYRKVTR